MANWYYSQDGQQQGPITEAELQQKVQSGKVASSSLVWKQGMGDWVAASTLTQFQVVGSSISQSTAPPSSGASPYAAPSAPVLQGYGVQPQQVMGARPRNYLVQSIFFDSAKFDVLLASHWDSSFNFFYYGEFKV